MRFHAHLSGGTEATPVDVEALGDGRFALTFDGRRREVDARWVGEQELSLVLEGRSHLVSIEVRGEALTVQVGPRTLTLELLDERSESIRGARPSKNATQGREGVRSPMPGKVVKLLVKAGDEVREGQGLVVVEAMKMENELRAPKAGRVVEVPALEGATVEAQTLLVVVE